MLDLGRLRAFSVFAEHLNFTHAARALHVSQPALHAQIAKLSDELGVVLYRRVGRTLVLTAHGVRVACLGRELIDRVRGFQDELRVGHSRQPVVLAAGAGAYLYLLGAAIRDFLSTETAPLRLLTADRDGSLEAVRHGLAHLAVATLDVPPGDLRTELLASVPQVAVVPDDHPLAARPRIHLTDLAGIRLIVPPRERPHRRVLEQALARAGVAWQVAVEASGWELMLHFAALGLGVAVVNGCCRIPPGFTAVAVADLPTQEYHVLYRATPLSEQAARLHGLLLTAGEMWRGVSDDRS